MKPLPFNRLRSLLLSPFLLALPLALFLILLLPFNFSKYTGEILQNGIIHKKEGFIYFRDLDHDGNSEQIVLFNNTENVASVKILGHDNFIRDHFYFKGRIIPCKESIHFFDDPATGQGSFQLLTLNGDSLLFHAVNAITGRDLCRNVHICSLENRNGKYDYSISQESSSDLDKDGSPEALFSVMAGFPLQPRCLFSFDFRKMTLKKNPLMGHLFSISEIDDINGDKYPEVLTTSYSVSNYPDTATVPVHDSSAYFLILDRDLKVVSVPWIFRGKYVLVVPRLWQTGKELLIPVLVNSRTRDGGPSRILMFDTKRKLLRSRILEHGSINTSYEILLDKTGTWQLYLVNDGGWALQMDPELQIIRRIDLKEYPLHGMQQMDVDNDGEEEIVFQGGDAWPMTIFRHDFSHPVQYNFPITIESKRLEVIHRDKDTPLLFVQQGNRCFTCDYRRNPFWIMRFPMYLGVYLLSLGFILLTRLLQRYALRQRYETERTIAGLQMQLVRNQLDPHFTFNAMNTISDSILQRRPEEANQNLLALSRLMRSFVTKAESPSWSIAEELDFLEHYIRLMRSRAGYGFECFIQADQAIDRQWQVPRMVTQVYVENAIRHGLRPLASEGSLTVMFSQQDRAVCIQVEDNGVGRKKAAEAPNGGTGKGLAMMEQLFALFNSYNDRKILCSITDITDNLAKPCGTRVEIIVPVEMRFEFLPHRLIEQDKKIGKLARLFFKYR